MDNGESSYRRYLRGDDNGIIEIITMYKDGLILYLNGYVKNIHLAEDLTEDTFFLLMVKKPIFLGHCSFKTWLYTIGRNLTTDYLRRNSRYSDVSVDELENYIAEEYNLEQSYIRQEQKIALHRFIQKLHPDYRQVLYLAYFEDFSNREIARILGKTQRQIRNLLYRAKLSLKSELEKEGFSYEIQR